ncbi:MAG TPA: GNAT family N-acetyltransferase [Acidimicrobiia bacterium]|nr:GNAT family N-acetyltransferase [Acidimicrobiia bacterium]
MDVEFRSYDPEGDLDALVDLLSTEEWNFRVVPRFAPDEARTHLARGYGEAGDITLVIEAGDELIGFVRAEKVGDEHEDPQLDFRLRERFRGRGIGTEAARRITAVVFERCPSTFRIEAQTRRDNIGMRTALLKAGYVLEAVYRKAWPDAGGEMVDGMGYAILRTDWESGSSTPVVWD